MPSRDDWQRRLGPLYGGAVALTRSTAWRWPAELGDAPRGAGWLIALGVPIGAAAWLVARLARAAGLPTSIAALLGLAMLSLAAAAVVERGLAEQIDRWDGCDREPGVSAVLVLVFATLVRAAAITALPPDRWLGALIATAVVGRWAAMLLQAIGDPVDDLPGTRSLVAAPAPVRLVIAASLGAVALAVLALGKMGIVALALAAIAALGLGLAAERRQRALTAGAIATAAAIGELAVLLVAAV